MKKKLITNRLVEVLIIFILINIFCLDFYAAQKNNDSQSAAYYTELAKAKMEEALLVYNGVNFPNKPIWAEAIEYGEKAIITNPNEIDAHYYLAQIYQYTNWYYKEAREWAIYIELVEEYNEISSQIQSQLAYAYYRLGYSAYQREEYDICVNYLEKAININPQMIEAYYWLGRVNYESVNLEDSYFFWSKVLAIDSLYPKAEYFLNKVEKSIKFGKNAYEFYETGYNFYNQKLYESAIYNYRQAINENKEFSEAYYWLGRIYQELGNYQEAVNNWKEVLRIEPDNNDAKFWLNQSEKKIK